VKSLAALAAVLSLAIASRASADPTSGVDAALFRSSYDTNGLFSLEGARLMPRRDLSFKLLMGYAHSPIDVAVPGIGGTNNTASESILDYLVTFEMTFGMTVTEKLAIGLDVGAYRTATGIGYGVRGRYAGGMVTQPSTGLIALRPLSNIDPSARPSDDGAYLGDGLAGPLDVRLGAKYSLYETKQLALAAIANVTLPFGDDEMLLGDRNLVYEPRVAFEYRLDPVRQNKVLANLGARIRNRAVLEGYDTADPMATADDSKVFLDVGSELVAGVGGTYEVTPRLLAAGEAQLFLPLPSSVGYGKCHRFNGLSCRSLDADDYWNGASEGDLTTLVTVGAMYRFSADVTLNAMVGAGLVGARGDDFRITTGITWAPQPDGVAAPGANDRDGDRIPDSIDGCNDEPEDKDGFQDDDGCVDADNDGDGIADEDDSCPLEAEDKDGFKDGDGCPEPDNDNDGVLDTADKCPLEAEDVDGFEDDDGCPDQDNDGDAIRDTDDKCPNDAETVNGFEDDDGCPDVRGASGPEERADRIDLKGQPVGFDRANKLTPAARALLTQAATIIKNRKLAIRVEVHTALGTRSNNASTIKSQRQRDKQLAQQRARQIQDILVGQGVPQAQLQAVGIGSDRPLGTAMPTDPINDRVDLIKAQQGTP
jgi:outer membrane protein OmpA-like peptidoglycan-associated protein